jgi:hypothetical protein
MKAIVLIRRIRTDDLSNRAIHPSRCLIGFDLARHINEAFRLRRIIGFRSADFLRFAQAVFMLPPNVR